MALNPLPPPLSRRRKQAFDEESQSLKTNLDALLAQVDEVLVESAR